jgi:iron complex transport system ATP-binding protein
MKTILEIQNLQVGFKQKVLIHVSKQFEAGKLVALIGRNGTGKSSLIRTLAGLQKELGGSVSIQGKKMSDLLPIDIAKLISVVFTQRPVVNGIDVKTLLEMGTYPHQKENSSFQEKINQVILELQLEHLLNQSIESLSDGEFQKAMIGRALVQETPVILLDEPTAFLDYVAKEEVMHLLRDIAHKSQKLIVFSSHDLTLVEKYADEKWILDSSEEKR